MEREENRNVKINQKQLRRKKSDALTTREANHIELDSKIFTANAIDSIIDRLDF